MMEDRKGILKMEEKISIEEARLALGRFLQQEIDNDRVVTLYWVIKSLYAEPIRTRVDITLNGGPMTYRRNDMIGTAMSLGLIKPSSDAALANNAIQVDVPEWLEETYQVIKKRFEEIYPPKEEKDEVQK